MSRVVVESRAYDARYDPVYTSSNMGNVSIDARVTAAVSSTDIVSGQTRYKYFRRPVMPRISAIPPTVLLAPTATLDPMLPVEEVPEPTAKDAGVQTVYLFKLIIFVNHTFFIICHAYFFNIGI